MIHLSSEQCIKHLLPLIELTMSEDVYKKAVEEFTVDDNYITDVWGYFDLDKLIVVVSGGAEHSPKKVWLGYFAVHPDYRGKGLGTAALEFMEEQLKLRGYKWILVETYDNEICEPAIALYYKLDYKLVGSLADYLDDDSDAIFLRKNIGD